MQSNSSDTSQHSAGFLSQLARLLRAEFAVEDPALCFGTGDADQSVPELQANMLREVIAALPATGSEEHPVLCSGPSVHALPAQENLRCSNAAFLEATSESAQKDWSDAEPAGIVIEGTVRYLDQLAVLQRARSLLERNGFLILLGEYLDDDSRIAYSDLANLSSLRQLSARLGFRIELEKDFSAGARLSVQKIMDLLATSDATLAADERERMQASLGSMRAEFESGRRCLRLFVMRYELDQQAIDSDIEFGTIDSFEPTAVAEIFQQSFDAPFNAELWRWKYQLGDGKCVIARQQQAQKILAHYGGAPRQIRYFGAPATAIQVCDVMALPEVRRHYGQGSLFFKTAATFLEREIGNTVGHLLGFGFPNQKAMHIATRLGLYEKTDDFLELVIPVSDASPALRVEPLEYDSQRARLDELWQKMSAEFEQGIIGIRDADYFDYRYRQHPYGRGGQYHCLQLLDDNAVLRAVAVCKRHGDNWLLLDLICAAADRPALLSSMAHWAAHHTSPGALLFWVTRGWLDAVNCAAATVNELGIEIPCNSWNPGPASSLLYGKWWLTAGDMDFM